MTANQLFSWMGLLSRRSSKTTDSSNLLMPSQSAYPSTSMAPKNADTILIPPQKSTFALSALQKPITPSLESAVPLLPDSTETVFDSPLPPPPPSPSTSSHLNILLKIATPYNAEAFESFLIQFPELRSRYPNIVPKLKNRFSMAEFPELETW